MKKQELIKGRIIFTERLYASIELVNWLSAWDITSMETLRKEDKVFHQSFSTQCNIQSKPSQRVKKTLLCYQHPVRYM